jgi:hypothetical protein
MKRRRLSVKRSAFHRVVEADDSVVDTSNLDGVQLAQLRAGEFTFVGVYARVVVFIPDADGKHKIIHEVRSPGSWGIEAGDDDYLNQVFDEECATLEHMLGALGVKVTREPVRLLLDETHTCTLADLLRQNGNLDKEDVRRLKSLAMGESFTLGGGAIAHTHVRRVS